MKIFRFLLVLCGTLFASMGLAGEIDGMRFIHIGLKKGCRIVPYSESIRIKKAICGLPLMTDFNKYDGYNFTVYRHQYKNPKSIASDITRCVVIDNDNRIWIGTREGLSLYNHRKNEFSNFFYKKRDKM